MKKNIIYIMAVAMVLLAAGPANAKILKATGTANTDITLGFSNDFIFFDIDGDGLLDRPGNTLNLIRDTFSLPDAKNVVRNTHIETQAWGLFDPLTNVKRKQTARATIVVRIDQDATFPFLYTDDGFGVFTVGPNRYFTKMTGAMSSLPFPLLRGTPYIDAAIAVVIINAKTGALVKSFTTSSTSVWQLLPYECRFADINGATHFIERFVQRDTAPLVPPFVKRTKILNRIWNAAHTTLIKQYVHVVTDVVR